MWYIYVIIMMKTQLKKKATFYEKNVTDYQKKVNDASIELCTGLLLIKRGDLLKTVRDKVHTDVYSYKKGKTRSSKRPKIDTVERQQRISEIQEEIADIDTRIGFKNCRIEAATAEM